MARRWRASLVLVLLLGTLAWGQQALEGYTFLPEARWGRLTAADANQRFYLEGRWHECFRPKVFIYKAPEAARDFLIVRADGVLARLTSNHDTSNAANGAGESLASRRSMVRIFGTAAQHEGRVVLVVERVVKLQDEDQTYLARLQALGPDVPAIQALGEEVRRKAELYQDPALEGLARRITERELEVRREQLRPGDHAAALALGGRMEAHGNRLGAIAVYADLVEETTDAAARAEGLRRLGALRAVRWGDEWMPYEAFKTAEGFMLRGDRWLRREDAELADARAREVSNPTIATPRTNSVQHAADARNGRITRGQTYAEVRVAGGLPARVMHLTAPDAQNQPARWSQWVLADGRRVYFLNGEVISTVAASEPWPER